MQVFLEHFPVATGATVQAFKEIKIVLHSPSNNVKLTFWVGGKTPVWPARGQGCTTSPTNNVRLEKLTSFSGRNVSLDD